MLLSRMAATGFLTRHSARIDDPVSLAHAISGVPGVVEHGLFIGLAHEAIVGGPDGVTIIGRS